MIALCALACPVCAQAPASPWSSLLLIAFIAVPFAVSAVVIRVIRNVDS